MKSVERIISSIVRRNFVVPSRSPCRKSPRRSQMPDKCDRCGEPFSDGDGATCKECNRTLCDVCFGVRNRADDSALCVRCRRQLEAAKEQA